MRQNPVNRGKLHRELGVAEGQPIPESMLRAALSSDDQKVRRAAQWALNRKGFGQGKDGQDPLDKYGIRGIKLPSVKGLK